MRETPYPYTRSVWVLRVPFQFREAPFLSELNGTLSELENSCAKRMDILRLSQGERFYLQHWRERLSHWHALHACRGGFAASPRTPGSGQLIARKQIVGVSDLPHNSVLSKYLARCVGWCFIASMILDWENCSAVSRSPKVMSGAVVFKHTRVPVSALFENLDDGATVDDFLEWFQGVTKDQVTEVLAFAAESLNTEALSVA